MQRHRVLPLQVDGNVITVGFIEDPTPQALAGVHQQLPGMEVKPVRITSQLFNQVLGSYAGAGAAAPAVVGEGLEIPTSEVSGENIPPLLRGLLERVVAEGGSDLHLCAGRKPLWRVDGDVFPIEDAAPLGRSEVFDLLGPVLQQRHRDEFAERRDTDFAVAMAGVGRFRVNLYWTHAGVSAAMRQIPWKILTLEQLGMPPVLKTFCMQPKGLVLVTGPTGSGKSTTLAAMVDYINRFRQCHIVTLEDPVEFVHQDAKALVNQREIGSQVESFARGLRAALREDPDVVLLGEIREAETAALALEIANTGHLVFATLHTNSAVSTVERLVDMFPGEQQNQARSTLADVLRGVVAQTLCKGRTGGRVAAVEVLVGGVAATNLIREGKPAQLMNVMQVGAKEGNRLLNDDLARLVRDHKVLYEEALGKAVDKYDLARRLGKVKGVFERTEGDKR
jgi:twitching motility protein PilT